jgi:hypothetical protein
VWRIGADRGVSGVWLSMSVNVISEILLMSLYLTGAVMCVTTIVAEFRRMRKLNKLKDLKKIIQEQTEQAKQLNAIDGKLAIKLLKHNRLLDLLIRTRLKVTDDYADEFIKELSKIVIIYGDNGGKNKKDKSF